MRRRKRRYCLIPLERGLSYDREELLKDKKRIVIKIRIFLIDTCGDRRPEPCKDRETGPRHQRYERNGKRSDPCLLRCDRDGAPDARRKEAGDGCRETGLRGGRSGTPHDGISETLFRVQPDGGTDPDHKRRRSWTILPAQTRKIRSMNFKTRNGADRKRGTIPYLHMRSNSVIMTAFPPSLRLLSRRSVIPSLRHRRALHG